MNDTVDKFGLREHMCCETECTGAEWNDAASSWTIFLKDTKSGIRYSRDASVVINAVGAISYPKLVNFEGLEKFRGKIFHTALWDHEYDYRGKRMALVGNGCSAAQVVPSVIKDVRSLKQYARGAQWYTTYSHKVFMASWS